MIASWSLGVLLVGLVLASGGGAAAAARSSRAGQSKCPQRLRRVLPPRLPFLHARRARPARSSLLLTQGETGMGRPSAPRSPLGTIQSSQLAWRRRARRTRQRRGRLTASSFVRGDHQVAELPGAHGDLGEELHRFGSLGGRHCCWRRLQGGLVCVLGWRCSFAVFGGQS